MLTLWRGLVYLLLRYTSTSRTVNIVPRFFMQKSRGTVEEYFSNIYCFTLRINRKAQKVLKTVRDQEIQTQQKVGRSENQPPEKGKLKYLPRYFNRISRNWILKTNVKTMKKTVLTLCLLGTIAVSAFPFRTSCGKILQVSQSIADNMSQNELSNYLTQMNGQTCPQHSGSTVITIIYSH